MPNTTTMQLLANVCANPLYDGVPKQTINQQIDQLQEKRSQLLADIQRQPVKSQITLQ